MVVCIPALSQVEVKPAASAVFSGSVDVELINIDVFVTDRRGNPITDLGIEDFEVLEDGKLVTISHFASVGVPASSAPAEDAGVKLSTEDLSTEGQLPATVDQESLLPRLIVVFDNRHLTNTAKRRLIKGLRQFLEGTSIPLDQVMLLSLGRGGAYAFDVEVPFGSTLKNLEEGLEHIQEMAPGGRSVNAAYRNLLLRMKQTHVEFTRRGVVHSSAGPEQPMQADANSAQICSQAKPQWRAEIRAYSEQATRRVNETVLRLARLMQVLSGVPGHKSLLYIGSGLELIPGEDLYAYANKICPRIFNSLDAHGYARTEVMKQLTEVANTYRISFSAFEASSFRLPLIISAEFKFSRYTPGANVEHIRTTNLQNSFVMLASETGGKAFLNSNGVFPDLEVLEKDLCSYYSLGYSPPNPGSEENHSIKVKLKEEKGLQLRYRRTYRERPGGERLDDKLMSVLALGWSQNPLSIRLGLENVKTVAGEEETFLVPLSVTVPINSLVCIPGQTSDSSCRVRLLMRSSDEKNRISHLYEKLYDIRLKKGTSPDEEVTLVLPNKMRKGNHLMAVGVMDDMGLTASYLSYPIAVGS
jgi:VWFA-related protein